MGDSKELGTNDRIEGFMVGGTTAITIANEGHAVVLTVTRRMRDSTGPVELVLVGEQSRRLRRLLAAAEKRAK